MSEKHEETGGMWLDRLDEIVDGVDEPSPNDDELLQIARQLHIELAPFRELDAPARAHRQRLRTRLRMQLPLRARAHSWKKWVLRPLVLAAALLLFILLGPGVIFEVNLASQNNLHSPGAQASQGWQMTDLPSTESYAIIPAANIPHGLALLLPTNLPSNAYLLAENANNYGADSPVQAYLVYVQYTLLYETPSTPLPAAAYSNSVYQTINMGNIPILVMHTSHAQNRLEWYQDGLLCDYVSDKPVSQMLATIRLLQLFTY